MKVKKIVCSFMLALAVGAPCCLAAPPDAATIINAMGIIANFAPSAHYNFDNIKQTMPEDWQESFPKYVGKSYSVSVDDGGPFIPENIVIQQAKNVANILKDEPSLLRINSDKGVMVVGDLHANLDSTKGILMNFLNKCQAGTVDNILFLGDFADREFWGTETLTLLYKMKSLMPENVHLIRGNHEDITTQLYQRDNTILTEIKNKYGLKIKTAQKKDGLKVIDENPPELLCAIKESYDMLPIAAVINNTCFCVHGGLCPEIVEGGISKIDEIQRPYTTFNTESKDLNMVYDMCWNSIYNGMLRGFNSWAENERGAGMCGHETLKQFLINQKFNTLVSGHVHRNENYDLGNGFRHIELLSSERYGGVEECKCCIATINNGAPPVIEEIDINGQVKGIIQLN